MLILGSPGFPGRDYLCSGQAVEDSEWQRKGLSPLAGDANRQKRGSSGSPQVWTAGWLCLSLCGNLAMRVYFPLPGGLRNAGIMNFDSFFCPRLPVVRALGDISYIVLFRMLFANNLILVAAGTTEREVCLPK